MAPVTENDDDDGRGGANGEAGGDNPRSTKGEAPPVADSDGSGSRGSEGGDEGGDVVGTLVTSDENPPAVGTSTGDTEAATEASSKGASEDEVGSAAQASATDLNSMASECAKSEPMPGKESTSELEGEGLKNMDAAGDGADDTMQVGESRDGADAAPKVETNPDEKDANPGVSPTEEKAAATASEGDSETPVAENVEETTSTVAAGIAAAGVDVAETENVPEEEEKEMVDETAVATEALAEALPPAEDPPVGNEEAVEGSDPAPAPAVVTESEVSSSEDAATSDAATSDAATSDEDDDDDEDEDEDDDDDSSTASEGEEYVVAPPAEPEPPAAATVTAAAATTSSISAPAAPASPTPRNAAPQSSSSAANPLLSSASPPPMPSFAENVPPTTSSTTQIKLTSGAAVAPAPLLPPALKKPEIGPNPADDVPYHYSGSSAAGPGAPPLLLCLPADSLHTVASFLDTSDWAALGEASRGANRSCREVFRRVRMHGFRCATEVVTAWARGEHADARELTALYIKSGVPIYPLCMGHSYHTLTWRMSIEAREMEQQANTEDGNQGEEGTNGGNNAGDGGAAGVPGMSSFGSAESSGGGGGGGEDGSAKQPRGPRLDRFYTERYDARQRDGYYAPTLTYLEEKATYWKYRAMEEDGNSSDSGLGRIMSPERRHSLSNAVSLRPPPPPPPPGAMPMGAPLGPPPPMPPPAFPPHMQGPGGAAAAARFGPPPQGAGAAAFHHAAGGNAQFGFPFGAGGFPPPPGGAFPPHHAAAAALQRAARGPPRRAMSNIDAPLLSRSRTAGAAPQAGASSAAQHQPSQPKMVVRVHRHLLDRHLLGRPAVNDDGGTMESSPLSLSADFFHPQLSSAGGPPVHPAAVYPSEYATSAYGEDTGMYAPHGAAGYVGGYGRPPIAMAPGFPGAMPPGPALPMHPPFGQPHYMAGPPAGAAGGEPGAEAGGAAALPIAPDFPLPAAGAAQEQDLVGGGDGLDDVHNAAGVDLADPNEDVPIPPAVADAGVGGPGGLVAADFDPTAGPPPGGRPPHPAFPPPGAPHHLRPYRLDHAVSFGAGPELSALDLGEQGWGAGGGYGGGMGGVGMGMEYSVVSDVSLEVYSSSSNGLPKAGEDDDGTGAVAVGGKAVAGSLPPISPSKLRHLRTRFLTYQRKLDSLLSHFDSSGFDECLLNFWDEFLPLTCGVHFHDRHTPVPRMSCLRRFLSQPCPKALGIVQCEIERIKISGRKGKKGVGVKGRLFPSYQYRLFVRDRRHGGVESRTGPPGEVRRDTVLMTARNRGKSAGAAAAAAASIVGSPSASSGGSKRGANNYFLYMPQEDDVEEHFKSVNDPSVFEGQDGGTGRNGSRSSAGIRPPEPFQRPPSAGDGVMSRAELGRLQSNFIGTEFQIFSPCIVKQPQPSSRVSSENPASYCSDSEDEGIDVDVDDDLQSARSGQSGRSANTSGGQSQTSSSRRQRRRSSGFGRLSSAARRSISRTRLSRSRTTSGDASAHSRSVHERGSQSVHSRISSDAADDTAASTTPSSGRKHRRRSSWSNLTRSAKVASRRAIAANYPGVASASGSASTSEPVFGEEENGVITYTANLLGNRPRIMDVCIPKVGEDGKVSNDWRRFMEEEAAEAGEGGSGGGGGGKGEADTMMSRFKQLQQRLDNPPAPTADGGNNNNGGGADNPIGAVEAGLDGNAPGGGDEGGVVGGNAAGAPTAITPDEFGLMALQNRPPWWNVELGAFVLNFGGRVSVASVKNFQLCDRTDQEHIMLQFGRIQGRHSFTMDFQYPLSAMQAFAIAISSLQSKISFG